MSFLVFFVLFLSFPVIFSDTPWSSTEVIAYFFMMAQFAFVLGGLPAMLIGAFAGSLLGTFFARLRNRFKRPAHLFINALLGSAIAAPLVGAWMGLLAAVFGNNGLLAGLESTLGLSPFCLAAGVYVGIQLERAASGDDLVIEQDRE